MLVSRRGETRSTTTITIRHHRIRDRAVGFTVPFSDRVRVLGPDHAHTLTTRHNLAYWQAAAGDVAQAVEGFQALLADRVRVLGPDHPDTLTTRAILARWARANQGLRRDP
ncbi:tetratricopeptide repeat protein [Longispora fulva]|uniref:tetratricopeptide repeat protein n=1 Tax=Longispora fulva TaxID=619741 RepID=UPI0018C9394F|nr:tetratricopeptide repeat protein [Longispora fulva]